MTRIKYKAPKAKEGVACAAWIPIRPPQGLQVSRDHCSQRGFSALRLAVATSVEAPAEEGFLPVSWQVYGLQLEQTFRSVNQLFKNV